MEMEVSWENRNFGLIFRSPNIWVPNLYFGVRQFEKKKKKKSKISKTAYIVPFNLNMCPWAKMFWCLAFW